MFCPKCGTSNPDGAKFCMSCQATLGASPETAALASDEILYAGFWERFAALFIDNILLSAVTIPVFFIIGIIAGLTGASSPSNLDALLIAAYLLPLLVSAAYFISMESGVQGATFGKRLLKLRVVDTDGNRIGKGRALGRWLAHALSYITLYIGYFMQPFTAKKQALHDMVSGTTVVKTEKTSNTVAIVIAVIAMFFVFIFVAGILAAVAIPAYQDYTIKARTNVAMVIGQQATMAVEEYYTRTGRVPSSLAETQVQIQVPSFLSGVVVNPDTGEVRLTFNSDMPGGIANKSMVFTPMQTPDGRITWKCSGEDIRPNLLPQSCR